MATIGEKPNLMDLLSKNSVVPLNLDHNLTGLIYVVREQTFYTNDQIVWQQFKEYRKDTRKEYQAFIENEEVTGNSYMDIHDDNNILNFTNTAKGQDASGKIYKPISGLKFSRTPDKGSIVLYSEVDNIRLKILTKCRMEMGKTLQECLYYYTKYNPFINTSDLKILPIPRKYSDNIKIISEDSEDYNHDYLRIYLDFMYNQPLYTVQIYKMDESSMDFYVAVNLGIPNGDLLILKINKDGSYDLIIVTNNKYNINQCNDNANIKSFYCDLYNKINIQTLSKIYTNDKSSLSEKQEYYKRLKQSIQAQFITEQQLKQKGGIRKHGKKTRKTNTTKHSRSHHTKRHSKSKNNRKSHKSHKSHKRH